MKRKIKESRRESSRRHGRNGKKDDRRDLRKTEKITERTDRATESTDNADNGFTDRLEKLERLERILKENAEKRGGENKGPAWKSPAPAKQPQPEMLSETTRETARQISREITKTQNAASPVMTFASVLENPIYKKREILYNLTPPSGFLHRTSQKNELVMELAPTLMGSAVSCVFIYGNPGTGKTGLTLQLIDELKEEAEKRGVSLKTAYINCSENRTETVILLELLNQLNPARKYPKMGWNRAKTLAEFNKVLEKDEPEGQVLIVLDEVDYVLRESGDDILYRLSRINSSNGKNRARVSTLVISNDVRVGDYIKPRTQSTLGRVKIVFAPYNSIELYDILKERAKYAFSEGVVSDAIIKKIAEIESSKDGDARKAMELLDNCAKSAIAKKRSKITLDLVDEADMHLENDQAFSLVSSLTQQQKLVYLSILRNQKDLMAGTDAFNLYRETCKSYNMKPLSERRIRSFVVNLQDLGLIKSEVGWIPDLKKKTRKIEVMLDGAVREKAIKILRDSI